MADFPTGREILEVKMPENDAGAETIHDYLRKLLKTLWAEGESFSGKRPFGNSGWEGDLFDALAFAGKIEGAPDDWDENRRRAAETMIFEAIEAL